MISRLRGEVDGGGGRKLRTLRRDVRVPPSFSKGGYVDLWHQRLFSNKGLTGRLEFTYLVEPNVTRIQLERLAATLAEDLNAHRISFVDFHELMVGKPSLGFWDRSTGPSLREKDWTKRPGPQDVQLWAERGSVSAEDDDAASILAAKHGLDTQLVKTAVEKVRNWIAGADT